MMAEKGYPPAGGAPYPPQGGGYPQAGAPPPYPGQGQPPPQGGYPQPGPQYGPVPTTVLVQAPLRFGETPIPMHCTYCQAEIVTGTEYTSGLATWLVAGACCIFGLWFGCCLIPFCIDTLKDVNHNCPNCRRIVGKYQRIS